MDTERLTIYVESDFVRGKLARIVKFHKSDAYQQQPHNAIKIGTCIKINKVSRATHGNFYALDATICDENSSENGKSVNFYAIKFELF